MSFRKKANFKSYHFVPYNTKKLKKDLNIDHPGEAIIFLNDKPISAYKNLLYHNESSSLSEFQNRLQSGIHFIKLQGGGLASQLELLPKVLYSKNYLKNKQVAKLRDTFYSISRTDVRRSYPKKYGGPKSRTRRQKSYR
jgi:small subunit ribosomal protein S9